ncbi:hypothetical protein CWI37_2468p0010, partial [Hamiltosporidium tvaerminnensis]
ADLGHSCSTTVTESSIECNTISRFPSRMASVLRFVPPLAGPHSGIGTGKRGYGVNQVDWTSLATTAWWW